MFRVFLGIGTNMGNKLINIERCFESIEVNIGHIIQKSNLYETEPWGVENQELFYNVVIEVKTNFYPVEILRKAKLLEELLGRAKTEKWGSRVIDIDILFFENFNFRMEDLTIPHPFLTERNFVLYPLEEIAPEFIHPKYKMTVANLKKNSQDKTLVKRLVNKS